MGAQPVEPSGSRPQPWRLRLFSELPLTLVVLGVGVGLLVIALHHFRWGNVAIASSLLAGALMRLALPARRLGLLAIRSRFTDVATMACIGGSLLVLALVTST